MLEYLPLGVHIYLLIGNSFKHANNTVQKQIQFGLQRVQTEIRLPNRRDENQKAVRIPSLPPYAVSEVRLYIHTTNILE